VPERPAAHREENGSRRAMLPFNVSVAWTTVDRCSLCWKGPRHHALRIKLPFPEYAEMGCGHAISIVNEAAFSTTVPETTKRRSVRLKPPAAVKLSHVPAVKRVDIVARRLRDDAAGNDRAPRIGSISARCARFDRRDGPAEILGVDCDISVINR